MSIWSDVEGVFVGPASVISSANDFMKWVAWILSPISWIRMAEFVTGMILMMTGLWALLSGQRNPTLATSGAGLARVTRNVAAATPAGRVAREAQGARMGKREGQRESKRMEARRHATRSEREASAQERADRERRTRQNARTRRPSHA